MHRRGAQKACYVNVNRKQNDLHVLPGRPQTEPMQREEEPWHPWAVQGVCQERLERALLQDTSHAVQHQWLYHSARAHGRDSVSDPG